MALADDISHFKATPWCAQLIEEPEFECVKTFARTPKSTTEDSFIAETLTSERTIRACLTMQKKPETKNEPITAIRVLYDIGDGVNGYVRC
jgi:acyl-coenzyme A thioesterase THEM4